MIGFDKEVEVAAGRGAEIQGDELIDGESLRSTGGDARSGEGLLPLINDIPGASGFAKKGDSPRDIPGECATAFVPQGDCPGYPHPAIRGTADLDSFSVHYEIGDVHGQVRASIVVCPLALADLVTRVELHRQGGGTVCGSTDIGGDGAADLERLRAAGRDPHPGERLSPLVDDGPGAGGGVVDGEPDGDVLSEVGPAAQVGHGDRPGDDGLPIVGASQGEVGRVNRKIGEGDSVASGFDVVVLLALAYIVPDVQDDGEPVIAKLASDGPVIDVDRVARAGIDWQGPAEVGGEVAAGRPAGGRFRDGQQEVLGYRGIAVVTHPDLDASGVATI